MKWDLLNVKKHNYVILLLVLLVYLGILLCSGFNHKTLPKSHFSDSLYAGSESCRSCHQAIYDSFIATAHNLTSSLATPKSIKGSFKPGKNHFPYNRFMEVVMEHKNGGFFQTSHINGQPFQSEPFNVVIGSGRKGQTYLYWKDDQLYQLPISYFVPTKSWCISPGYPLTIVRFDRVIVGRCIECHGSRAEIDEINNTTYFNKNSVVLGVNCERCHGPAAKHVQFHKLNKVEKTAQFITTKNQFSRQQSLDVCALCHSGIRQNTKPPFSFVAGEKLADYSLPNYNEDSSGFLDVHGNQHGLLAASKCFKKSLTMNCSSCHNVHKEEVNAPKLFSSRCITCHNNNSHITCTLKETKNITLSDNCIDCHMPVLASKNIFLQTNDSTKSSADYVRTHLVSIYPEITKKILEKKAVKQ